ncbi:MAG TPA: methyltransferase domain-containing protein [Stellaceae bacterium]
MATGVGRSAIPATGGKVFHWPMAYDLLLRLFWGRAEPQYRSKLLGLARLGAGESVLDVGCGTGTLAIAAKRRVGPTGKVLAIDASRQMVARARRKAAAAAADIDVQMTAAETLPFPDATFDAVLSTTVLHCLPDEARRRAIREMRRVLKPDGRLLLVDFAGPATRRRTLMGRLNDHRHFDLNEIVPILRDAGFARVESDALGFSDLAFALATAPAAADDL